MKFVSWLLIASGVYFIDSAVKDRPPIGYLRDLIVSKGSGTASASGAVKTTTNGTATA